MEARNESHEIFGTERIEKVLTENAHLSAQVIANRMLATVRQYTSRRSLDDDITIVVVKMK
jgi:serine phosphatase RsbU (regulator of sigma subunit)